MTTYRVAAFNASNGGRIEADLLCDGTADDVQINAAIQALPAGGGKIELSRGVFYLSDTIRIDRNNVTLQGAGAAPANTQSSGDTSGGTRLQATSELIGEGLKCETDAQHDHPPANATLHGVLLRDFTLDMMGYGTDGIKFCSHRGLMDNIQVHSAPDNGIRVTGYSTWTTYDTMLAHCRVYACSEAGFLFDQYSPDLHMVSCVAGLGNKYGLRARSANHIISACHFYGSTQVNVFFDDNGIFSKVVGCKMENSQQHGLQITCSTTWVSGIIVQGCVFRNNGKGAHNTYDHIIIGASGSARSKDHIISGNIFWSDQANKPRYGVNVDAGGDGVIVAGNHFRGTGAYGTNPIHIDPGATGCLVTDNLGAA